MLSFLSLKRIISERFIEIRDGQDEFWNILVNFAWNDPHINNLLKLSAY